MKKWWTVVLAATLAVSVAACSSKNNGETQSGNTPSPAASPTGSASATPSPTQSAMDKKFKITDIEGTWTSIPGENGEGIKKVNEKFNVDFSVQVVPYDQYTSKLPVVMAGGDLPDIIGMETVDANFVKWAKQGAFLPLNDYIDKYPTLKAVPQNVWDAVSVDGKIYAIPQYFPTKYGQKPVIRQDWLDNLGLQMPTTYEELKKVAIAFTKDDPDQNGKDDTYGFALAMDIVYGAPMGPAWDESWYHKNEQGQLIPGMISEGYKEQIQFLADLYKEGALHKDWAVSKIVDVRKDFYAGKFGIWFQQPNGIDISLTKAMAEQNPKAKFVMIPPFKQADGQQGFTASSGYYTIKALNAKLASEPDKLERILQMEDYFRTFIPIEQRNSQNPDFDWQNGGEGVGYTMVNGVPDFGPVDKWDVRPVRYYRSVQWAPSDEALNPAGLISEPLAKSYAAETVEQLKNTKFYLNPVFRIYSEKLMAKESELKKGLIEWQTKMIVGKESISNWNKMVDEYLAKGGKEVIDDVNRLLQEKNIQGEWK